jgi:metacaspase-1
MAKLGLCIGVNNYPGTHMDLEGCVNDAKDWAAELGARGFEVTQLLDDKATKAAMVNAFKKVIGAAGKGDIVVITFSGHGTYVPDLNGDEIDGLDEALCPYDIQTGGGALIDDEIHAMFAARKPGVHLVLLSDSCHLGTVTRAAGADPDSDDLPRALPADGQLASCGSAAAGREWQAGRVRGRDLRRVALRERAVERRGRPASGRVQGGTQ